MATRPAPTTVGPVPCAARKRNIVRNLTNLYAFRPDRFRDPPLFSGNISRNYGLGQDSIRQLGPLVAYMCVVAACRGAQDVWSHARVQHVRVVTERGVSGHICWLSVNSWLFVRSQLRGTSLVITYEDACYMARIF
eukprot:2979437-Prymnesium_polylepis.2